MPKTLLRAFLACEVSVQAIVHVRVTYFSVRTGIWKKKSLDASKRSECAPYGDKLGKGWQKKRKQEHFYRKAKREGYRSRAAYKLKQLNKRYDLIEPGDVVVDLGAAPGGWLQVARELVGSDGLVLGIDLQRIEDLGYENVVTIRGDIRKPETIKKARDQLAKLSDVVLSDASPKITGAWGVDHARSVELGRAALNFSKQLLVPDGRALTKVFQGDLFNDLVKDVEKTFDFVKTSKPKASRKRSAETYIIGKGLSRNRG